MERRGLVDQSSKLIYKLMNDTPAFPTLRPVMLDPLLQGHSL